MKTFQSLSRFFASGIFLIALIVFTSCDSDRIAGGNGSETTNGVSARILYPDGKPAKGMTIKIRTSHFLKGDKVNTVASMMKTGADTLTDSMGYFTIQNLSTDDYVIEASGDSLYGLVLRLKILAQNSISNLHDLHLEKNGSVSGQVNRGRLGDSITVSIQIYGLDRKSICKPDGSFELSLAPGAYGLRFASSNPDAGSLEIPQVTCLAGAQTRLTNLSLPIDYKADSLAVRTFLNDAGLTSVDWNSIVGIQDNRIRILNLNNLGLKTLPASIGKIVSLIALDINENPLTSLPNEIASLSGLETLSLHGTALDSIPNVVLKINSLKYLYLGKSGLKSIPAGIDNLKALINLDLDSNSLTSLPAEICNLGNLGSLRINDNLMDSLPADFGKLGNLVHLLAYHNKLKVIPASIGSLALLQDLLLETNQLTYLPVEVGNLPSLRILTLGDNNIATLPASITSLKPDRQLSVWHNRLCTVSPEVKTWLDKYDFENYGGKTGPIWQELQLGCP